MHCFISVTILIWKRESIHRIFKYHSTFVETSRQSQYWNPPPTVKVRSGHQASNGRWLTVFQKSVASWESTNVLSPWTHQGPPKERRINISIPRSTAIVFICTLFLLTIQQISGEFDYFKEDQIKSLEQAENTTHQNFPEAAWNSSVRVNDEPNTLRWIFVKVTDLACYSCECSWWKVLATASRTATAAASRERSIGSWTRASNSWCSRWHDSFLW
jgi:hypothetical protein